MIKNLRSCYDHIGSYLSFGKMIKPLKYECDKEKLRYGDGHFVCDKIFSSAWEYQGRKMQLFVNHTSKAVEVRMENCVFEVEALSAVFLTW